VWQNCGRNRTALLVNGKQMSTDVKSIDFVRRRGMIIKKGLAR
jgi:hypothetical protein